MKICPINRPGHCRTGNLENVNVDIICKVLGFHPNVDDDPYKAKYSWGFQANDCECGIWDYKDSSDLGTFSTYGPDTVFEKLFGDNYVSKLKRF